MFLQTVIRETGIQATIHNKRIESQPSIGADIVTARALAPIDRLRAPRGPACARDEVSVSKGCRAEAESGHARNTFRYYLQASSEPYQPELLWNLTITSSPEPHPAMSPSGALSPLPIRRVASGKPPSINLATALAACGRNVLLIDFDPQGNASTGLGIDDRAHNSYSLIAGSSGSDESIQKTQVRASISFRPLSTCRRPRLSCPTCRTGNFGFACDIAISTSYDYIIIDCPRRSVC